jgi:hypothetical protein
MEVKEETIRATRKGTAGFVSTPLTGKSTAGPPLISGRGKQVFLTNTIFVKLMSL